MYLLIIYTIFPLKLFLNKGKYLIFLNNNMNQHNNNNNNNMNVHNNGAILDIPQKTIVATTSHNDVWTEYDKRNDANKGIIWARHVVEELADVNNTVVEWAAINNAVDDTKNAVLKTQNDSVAIENTEAITDSYLENVISNLLKKDIYENENLWLKFFNNSTWNTLEESNNDFSIMINYLKVDFMKLLDDWKIDKTIEAIHVFIEEIKQLLLIEIHNFTDLCKYIEDFIKNPFAHIRNSYEYDKIVRLKDIVQ